jgi:uncharacterized membrane protein
MAASNSGKRGAVSPAHYHRPRSVDDLTRHNIETVSRLEEAMLSKRTLSDRVADIIAGFCGSMAFVWVHVLWFSGWVVANTILPIKHMDPFPFQFLTLIVSLEAIFLTTFVMISQNRQGRASDRRNHLDLQINLLAEQENSKMLQMLDAIMHRLKITDTDPDVRVLEEATEPAELVKQIDEILDNHTRAAEQQT